MWTGFVTTFVTLLALHPVCNWPAAAQAGGAFVGATAGSAWTQADAVEGAVTAAGVLGGYAVRSWLAIEAEWVWLGGPLQRDYTGVSVIIDGRPVMTRFSNSRQTDSLASVGIGIRLASWGRVTPRAFLGVSNVRVRDQVTLVHIEVPPGVMPAQLEAALPPQPVRRRNLGGPTVGGSLAIAWTPRLSIVPDVRVDYGSLGDEINNMVRPSVRVQWRFE